MDYLYHGSIIAGISQIEPRSILHNTGKKVVYLTDNVPYALFYIWDKEHNHYEGKHITAWIKDGTAYYEEQFSNQLKTFYKGVSGYLYPVPFSSCFKAVENRECMYYSAEKVLTEAPEYIPDVYDELLKYETMGELKIRRYNEQSEQKQKELINMIADAIVKFGYFNDKGESEFYKRYFAESWERAAEKLKENIK